MDLNASRRRLLSLPNFFIGQRLITSQNPRRSFEFLDKKKLMKIPSCFLISLPFLVAASLIFAGASVFEGNAENIASSKRGEKDDLFTFFNTTEDRLLGGLLAAGFDEGSCLSRYQFVKYHQKSYFMPSSHLLSRLRNYESMQKRCGPHSKSYNKTMELLKTGNSSGHTDCNYVVWVSFSSLENKILTLASAFLYALLTDRVLLVDGRGSDMAHLFCEPFPQSSWLLPTDFPMLNQFESFDRNSPHSYGTMLEKNMIDYSKQSLSSFLYLHLVHDYGHHDKLFFCDQDQTLLEKVPWLIMKSDNYFIPSLFLIPIFEQELDKLFPFNEKATVFHHLGRYLFHPSNQVWGLITRYYQAYLAMADERIGIQIGVLDSKPGPVFNVIDQIIACTLNQTILPEIENRESERIPPEVQKLKAVVVTSFDSRHYEKLKNMYWENPTKTGEIVSVHKLSHEDFQETGQKKMIHEQKEWAEMYLLSLTDVLVTSSWSKFGYVAQGLSAPTPWILFKPENQTTPDPPCRLALSKEPCFLAPPFYDCKSETRMDPGYTVSHVMHCEDMSWGLKLVDGLDVYSGS